MVRMTREEFDSMDFDELIDNLTWEEVLFDRDSIEEVIDGCDQRIIDKIENSSADYFLFDASTGDVSSITPVRDKDDIYDYFEDWGMFKENVKRGRNRICKRHIKESFSEWSEKEQLSKIKYALDRLIEAWNDCNDILLNAEIDNDLLDEIIVGGYPFDRSLEEVDFDVSNWLDDCITRVVERQRNLMY